MTVGVHPATDDEPLRLPPDPTEPPRPAFPLWAMIVPVIGALLLWQVTGSSMMLWFAALGPLVAVAGMLDASRGRRRARRRAEAETRAAIIEVRDEIGRRHERERAERWRRCPDVERYLSGEAEPWRVSSESPVVVLGAGGGRSRMRIAGDAASASALRRDAAALHDVPITVPLTAGIAVVGPEVAAAAVVRGLLAQLCLAYPPGALRIERPAEPWLADTPHAQARAGLRVWSGSTGSPVPADADVPIVRAIAGAVPPRCAAVLRLTGPDEAVLDLDGVSTPVRPEPLGRVRAESVARLVSNREAAIAGAAPVVASFGDLVAAPGDGLRVALGSGAAGLFSVDLVEEGPHAVIVGTTGSGKSELLVTWVAALAAQNAPDRVTFLLIDFKGGRSFDVLTALPHVTGVVTDLDEAAALRAIESLAAEVRHRERVMAEHGARDVDELVGVLPRLVIVVDEYAALTAAHPGLQTTFADIAARGRALGMHLVLATQRAAGIREAVLANAPLRIALRVADDAESRAVIGCIDAAALSGAPGDRGTALVRGAADGEPRLLRVARCGAEAIDAIAAATHARGGAEVRRPWLPALPDRLALDQVRRPGSIVIGLADEPGDQRQTLVTLPEGEPGLFVAGRAGAGRSTLVHAVVSQVPDEQLLRIPADPEAAWDLVGALGAAPRATVIVVDDLDLLLARYPAEYAASMASELERAVREARGRGIRVVCSAQRVNAQVARIVDQLTDRVLLATVSRAEHVALGGDAAHHDPALPRGRGRWRGTLVQVVDAGEELAEPPRGEPATMWPRHPAGFVAPAGARTTATLDAWQRHGLEIVERSGSPTGLRPGRVVWGPPEAWVGQWPMPAGAAVIGAGPQRRQLIVDAACEAELRLITRRRDLPPYAAPGRDRAWLFDTAVERVRRVRLPREASETS